jgi:pyruvate dehydrogenase E2 component (dihydrolipoamide acetyltransferase)
MPNLEVERETELSTFRKIALGTWRTTRSSVYGGLTLRMDRALDYLEAFRRKTGRKATVTHLMARAAGAVFERAAANALLRFGRICRRRIGVFFRVVGGSGHRQGRSFGRGDSRPPDQVARRDLRRARQTIQQGRKNRDSAVEDAQLVQAIPTWRPHRCSSDVVRELRSTSI